MQEVNRNYKLIFDGRKRFLLGNDLNFESFRHAQTLTSSHSTRSALPRTVLGVEGNIKRKFYSINMSECSIIGTQIPYVKHFVLSKSTQYRKLKTEWRQNVFLAKSRIQVKIELFQSMNVK